MCYKQHCATEQRYKEKSKPTNAIIGQQSLQLRPCDWKKCTHIIAVHTIITT